MKRSAPPFFVEPADPPSKREILQAALALFNRDGLDATTVRAIAAASGYSNPALFKFFATKEELARTLFERCYLKLAHSLSGTVRGDRPFAANLRALLGEVAGFADESPDAFLFVHDHLRRFWSELPAATRRQSLVAVVRTLVAPVAAGSGDGDVAVAAVIGTVAQLVRMIHFGEVRGPMAALVPAMEKTLRRMLSA